MWSDEWISKMPRGHLSSCVQASYSNPALQMKRRQRALMERLLVLSCVHVSIHVFWVLTGINMCRWATPNTRRKQKERKQSKPLNLSAICAFILYTHVRSILAQLLGQGSAGLGPGPFSWDNPPPFSTSSSSPFLCSLWTHSEATRLHNSSQSLHFLNTGMKKKCSLTLEMGLRGKNN